jgi:hypothetical protein
MRYVSKPASGDDTGNPSTCSRKELIAERDALGRWAGEGGAPSDPCHTLARIEAGLARLTREENQLVHHRVDRDDRKDD